MSKDKPKDCYTKWEQDYKDGAESCRDDDRDGLEYNNSEEENDNQ